MKNINDRILNLDEARNNWYIVFHINKSAGAKFYAIVSAETPEDAPWEAAMAVEGVKTHDDVMEPTNNVVYEIPNGRLTNNIAIVGNSYYCKTAKDLDKALGMKNVYENVD